MMTQSIVIQVGQCGNQIGHRFWDLALQELGKSSFQNGENDTFFREVENKSTVNASHSIKARALLVDMEEGVISEIMKGPLQDIFDSKQLLTDASGSGNNWATGHFLYGSLHQNDILDLLRREAEECESLQSFFLLHSLGGGTGSGLGTCILEMLCDNYPKQHRFVTAVYPSACDDVVTSPYNALLAKNYLIEFADCVFPVENKALGDICNYMEKNTFTSKNDSSIRNRPPTDACYQIREKPFDCMNNIIADLLLNITCSSRFPGSMNVDLNEIIMNMVPFERLHFISSSVTPLSSLKSCAPCHGFQNLFPELFSSHHNLFKQELKRGTFLSCALLLRGHICLSDIQKSMERQCSSLKFSPWIDNGWKTGLCNISPLRHPWSAVLLCNNNRVCLPFYSLRNRFLKMYNKKAHLHHFLQVSGMEKDIIDLSLQNLTSLTEEYRNVGQLLPDEPRMQILI